MRFAIGLIMLALVLSFITYELGYGGGKREEGRSDVWRGQFW